MSFAILLVEGEWEVKSASPGTQAPTPYRMGVKRGPDLKISLKSVVTGNRIIAAPYIPATSWVGVLRSLLEKYYDLPANVPRVAKAKKIVAPIHECESEEEKLRCPVCKLLARRDVVAWFDDAEPIGALLRVEEREAEVNFYNERNELVARIYRKDEVTLPRTEREKVPDEYKDWKREPIPRTVQLISGRFKFSAKFLISLLEVEDLRPFFVGLSLMEDYYVGRRGSRGYGRISIKNLSFKLRGREYYEGRGGEIIIRIPEDAKTPKGVLRRWEEIKGTIEEELKRLGGQ